MLEVKWFHGMDEQEDAKNIRLDVFCTEQGYGPSDEFDEIDDTAWQAILYAEGKAVATGRLYETQPRTFALGRIAVRAPWRGSGAGRVLMQAMMDRAESLHAEKMILDAQTRVVGFYKKLGFTVCGEEHMDGHVPHTPMEKSMERQI